jgi:hypothetical protein
MKDKCPAARRSKWLLLSCAFLFSSVTVVAQEKPESNKSNIEILKLHWEKQVRLPRNFDPSVIPTGGTFNDPALRTSAAAPTSPLEAARANTRAQSAAAGGSSSFPDTPARLPIVYIYSMKVKNDGAKMIEGVAWDYVFTDKSSNREVGRHQFLSYERVATGKIVTFKSQLRSPPTRVVQVSNSREKHRQLTERAVVQCVLYADDSSWKNQDAPIDACSLLRKSKDLLKQNRRESRTQ